MDFPIADLMDERACYDRLVGLFHPGGGAMTVARSCGRHWRSLPPRL